MNPDPPPRLANWLLRWLVPKTDREQIMGDLVEEFSLRAQSSDSCWSWYWSQTLRSIPPIAWMAARQGRWIRTFLVALGAYIASGLLESMADAVLLQSVNPQSLLHSVVSLIIGLATITAAGYIAARFRPGAETVMGAIVVAAVIVLLAARVGEVPPWYGFTFLIAGPLASLAGGALFLRGRT